jgi:hypothetical protein
LIKLFNTRKKWNFGKICYPRERAMQRRYSPLMTSRRKFLAGTGAVAAGLTFAPFNSFSAEEKKINFCDCDLKAL